MSEPRQVIMPDLDYAAIMAEHEAERYSRTFDDGVTFVGGDWCTRCADHAAWPCEPYRLAADLAEANRKLADVWDKAYRLGVEDERTAAAWDTGDGPNRVNPYLVTLTGDQEQREGRAERDSELLAQELLGPTPRPRRTLGDQEQPKPEPEPIEVGEVVWTDGWR